MAGSGTAHLRDSDDPLLRVEDLVVHFAGAGGRTVQAVSGVSFDLLEGEMVHRDSSGHSGHLGPGDVQWMTAGDGIVHSELPDPDFKARGGRTHGFQIWVNLPKRDKRMTPRYQDVPARDIPEATSEDS